MTETEKAILFIEKVKDRISRSCDKCPYPLSLGEYPCKYHCEDIFALAIDALRRTAEYDKAQSEGRVVVFPCKEGDKIYNTASFFSTLKEPEEHIVEGFSTWRGEMTILCKGGYKTFESKICKTVFLTRAEAEAALGKERVNGKDS